MLSNKKGLIADFRLTKIRFEKSRYRVHGRYFFAILNESSKALLRLGKFIPPGEWRADDYLRTRMSNFRKLF